MVICVGLDTIHRTDNALGSIYANIFILMESDVEVVYALIFVIEYYYYSVMIFLKGKIHFQVNHFWQSTGYTG